MRVLVMNQYFPPDIASTGIIVKAICDGIAETGVSVTAIVGQPSYTSAVVDAPALEERGHLVVRRVPMGSRRGRGSVVTRALGYARFLWGAWLTSRVIPCDLVVTFHNPPFLGLLGAWLAYRRGIPFVYVIQDIHPDILAHTHQPRVPRWLISIWRRLSHLTLHRSHLTITLSDAMRAYLVKTYGLAEDAVISIPLWAHPDLEQLPTDSVAQKRARETLALSVITSGNLVVLYAGNMGVMHPVEILADAAANLRSSPISFVFVGDGTKRHELERQSKQLSLHNVQFLPFQPIREFELLVQAADVCTVALQNGLEDLCLPSRTPTFMSGGRPILAVMAKRSPQSREIIQTGSGWVADSVEGVTLILEALVLARDRVSSAGSAARSTYRERYRREPLVARYVHAILRCASPQAMADPPSPHPPNLATPRPN